MSRFYRERLPSAESFYRDEIGKVSRPNGRGWAMGRCPFHESKSGKSLSVNVRGDGGFYCFGCGAKGGSILTFVMHRDGLTFRAAAERLGCWGDPETPAQQSERKRQDDRRRAERERANAAAESQRQTRIEARDELLDLRKIQRNTEKRLAELNAGATPNPSWEREDCLDVLSLLIDQIRAAEETYATLAGLEPAWA